MVVGATQQKRGEKETKREVKLLKSSRQANASFRKIDAANLFKKEKGQTWVCYPLYCDCFQEGINWDRIAISVAPAGSILHTPYFMPRYFETGK